MATPSSNPNPLSTSDPWNLVADGYAADGKWVMAPFSERAICLTHLPKTASVVDVAAGPGTLTIPLAPLVASIDAVDFSDEMLAILRSHVAAAGLTNVTVEYADGQALPFPDNAYDAAFSLFGLMFFPDRKRGFAELLRVLKPGGTAVISSWAPLTESTLFAPIVAAMQIIDPDMHEPKPNPDSLENVEVFRAEMIGAGFGDVKIVKHTETMPQVTYNVLWDRFTHAHVGIVGLRKRIGESEWRTADRRAREFLRRDLGPDPIALSTTAYFGIGVKP